MKKIVYTQDGGDLAVVNPHPGARYVGAYEVDGHTTRLEMPIRLAALVSALRNVEFTPIFAETEDEFVVRIKARHVPTFATDAVAIDEGALPADRTFRNAWRLSGRAVEHDMEKARSIHMSRVRVARDDRLADLDKKWMRSYGRGEADDAAAVEVARQKLRDIPLEIAAAVEAASTPEELKTIWPRELAVATMKMVAG